MIILLLFYVLGAIPTLLLAVVQKSRLSSGKSKLVYDNDYELHGSFLRVRKRRKVDNGVCGFDWLPSDLIKMALVGGFLWLIFGIMWIWFEANELINKIDGDEKD